MLRDRSLKRRRLPMASPERPELNGSLSQYMKQIEKVKKSIECIAKEYQTSGTLFRRNSNSNSNSKKFSSTAKTAPTNPKSSNLLSPDANSDYKEQLEAEDKEESRILNIVYEKYPKPVASETDQSLKQVPLTNEADFKAKEIALSSLVNDWKNIIEKQSIEGKKTQVVTSGEKGLSHLHQPSDQKLGHSAADLRKYWPTMEDNEINKLTEGESVTPKSQQITRNGFALGQQSPSIIEAKQISQRLKEEKDESQKSTSPIRLTTPDKILSQLTKINQDISTDQINQNSRVISAQNMSYAFKKTTQEYHQTEEVPVRVQADEYESVDAQIQDLNSSRTGEAITLRNQENRQLSFQGQPSDGQVLIPVSSLHKKPVGQSKYPFAQTDESKDKLSWSEEPAAFELKRESEADKNKDTLVMTFGNQPLPNERNEMEGHLIADNDKKKSISEGEAKISVKRTTEKTTQNLSEAVDHIQFKTSVTRIDSNTPPKKHADQGTSPRLSEHHNDASTSPKIDRNSLPKTREEFAQTEPALVESQVVLSRKERSPSNLTITNKCPHFAYQKQSEARTETQAPSAHKTEKSIKNLKKYFTLDPSPKKTHEFSSSQQIFKNISVPPAEAERKLSPLTQTTPVEKETLNKTSKTSLQEKRAANISVNEVKFLNNSIKNLQEEIDSLRDKVSVAEMERDNFLCSHKKACDEINILRNQIELLRQNLAERKYMIGELVDLVVASNDPGLQSELNRILNESAFK